jgi:Mycothiol maleylpyruvate isomerase N-terminal domain
MDYVAENAAARNRILSLVAGLTDAEMAIPSEDGWTIGAQLAHLAFWDRVHSGRLRASLDSGGDLPGSFPPGAVDEINNAGLEAWRLIPGTAAIRWFAEASSEVDAYLASLDPSVVNRIRSAGLPRLVERHRHRTDHGAAIEQALHRR